MQSLERIKQINALADGGKPKCPRCEDLDAKFNALKAQHESLTSILGPLSKEVDDADELIEAMAHILEFADRLPDPTFSDHAAREAWEKSLRVYKAWLEGEK